MHRRTFEELRKLALSKRATGLLTIDYDKLPIAAVSAASAADSFVASHGFRPLGKAWRIIQRSEALDSLYRILFRDLAYQQLLMEEKTARFIAESFLDLFSPHHSRYCTNGSFDERSMLGWTPITEATFDHGIVAFDEEHIGMIWVQDED